MIYNVIFKVYLILLHLIVPGTGLVAIGKWKSAFYLQGGLLLCLMFLCWTRLIFEPIAIKFFLTIIIVAYITGIILISVIKIKLPNTFKSSVLQPLLFVIFSSAIFISGFIFKDKILGVHINFVPSMSMYPTLKPGQFILIDTWIFSSQEPEENDIVVFLHEKKKLLVKRIAHWSTGELKKNNQWYLLGDNATNSRDSRYFGGVESNQFMGKVMLVLLEINNQHRINQDSILQPIQ